MTMTTSVPGTARTPWVQVAVYPVVAAAAFVLVLRDQRIGLAAFLVSVPTVAGILGVLAFTVSVFISGS